LQGVRNDRYCKFRYFTLLLPDVKIKTVKRPERKKEWKEWKELKSNLPFWV
jgi:hypothetical protein